MIVDKICDSIVILLIPQDYCVAYFETVQKYVQILKYSKSCLLELACGRQKNTHRKYGWLCPQKRL